MTQTSNWFLLWDKEPLSAETNMARDEFFFDACHRKKMGILRLYSWKNPTFSIGVSQRFLKAVNIEFISNHNCSYVRRITGGKAVLHHNEITYSVISSEDFFFKNNDLYRSYLLISRILVQAFQAIGLDAYLSQGSPSSLSKSNNPCFSFPTPNELEIGGKKIVGSAQKRDKIALLQHGSIPISMDYDLYAGGTRNSPEFIRNSMTTLSDVTTHSGEDLSRALIDCFQSTLGVRLEAYEFNPEDSNILGEIEKKYASYDWNHRI